MNQIQAGSSASSARVRRERLIHILDGRVELPVPGVERSALQEIAQGAAPESGKLTSTWPRGLGLATVLLMSLIVFQPNMQQGWIVAGVALVVCAFVEAIVKWFRNTKELRYWSRKLGLGLDELVGVHKQLTEYLLQLDKRTSKYFHCVTNTKVTTYCILKQVLSALDERISTTSRLINRGSPTSLINAHAKLRELLAFRDGFLQHNGREHFLAPSNVGPAVHLLIEELDYSLVELEQEIKLDSPDKAPPLHH